MRDKMMGDKPDVENVGIMQGFMDAFGDDDLEEEEGDEDTEERRPDSPEILMNNLRGDMRSIDARRDELADLVGYAAASETPEPVLAMLQPILAQQGGGGIGGLPQSTPMAQGPQPPMAMPPGPPPADQGGIAALIGGAPPGPPPGLPAGGIPSPVAMANGGLVQRFSDGSDEDGVTPIELRDEPRMSSEAAARLLDPETKALLRQQFMGILTPSATPVQLPTIESAMAKRIPQYEALLGNRKEALQGQVLLDLAQRAFGYAANVDEQGRPLRGNQASRMLAALRGVPGTMAAAGAEATKADQAIRLAALQAAEKDISSAEARQSRAEQARTSAILGAARSGMLIESAEDRAAKAQESKERLQGLRIDSQEYRDQFRSAVRERIAAEDRASRENTEEARLAAAKARKDEENLNRRLISTENNITRLEIATQRGINQKDIQESRDTAAMARTTLRSATAERIAAENRASKERTSEAIQEAITARQREAIAAQDARAAENRANAFAMAGVRSQTALDIQTMRNQGRAFTGGWFMPIVTDPSLARAFASGNTDEETDAKINAAVIEYSKPVMSTSRDPETGALITTSQQRPVPQYWQEAFKARNIPVPAFSRDVSSGLPSSMGGATPPTSATGAPAATPEAIPALIRPIAPSATRQTLWDVADKMTGPVTAAKAAISAIPGLGFIGADDASVRKQGQLETESLIEASLKNSKAPIDEQRRLRGLLNVGPTISDVTSYRSNLLGIAQTLLNEYQSANDTINNPNTTVDMRKDARIKAQATSKLLERVAPPIYDRQTYEAVKPLLQPGAFFLYLDPEKNILIPGRVPAPKR